MKIHEIYINRCLELAKTGVGNTYPNPSVGCVIVYQNKIIGEGYTSEPGGPHAEVNAINSVKNKSLLKKATLYVTLEPCSHFGKTPPCANLIVKMKIPKVVIGTLDSNEEVSGRGVKKLIEGGCDVTIGVLEEACRESNKRFFCYHEKHRPYIILKWAESADGFIAPDPTKRNLKIAQPVWLSNKTSRQLVHKWRSEEQAILVGTATAIADNPSLTTRDWFGNNPLRVIIDKQKSIPKTHTVLNGNIPTLIFTNNPGLSQNNETSGPQYIELSKETSFPEQVAATLYKRNIQSIIIEGGAETLKYFIRSGLWDEARVFRSPQQLGCGIPAPALNTKAYREFAIADDELFIFYKKFMTTQSS